MEFNFHMPTKVFFGFNCIEKHSHELKRLGPKCLIVCGNQSAKMNGSLSDITSALNKENIEFEIFNEVEPNPSIETVTRGGLRARELKVDFIIGIGGGSPMDAAKAVAIVAKNEFSEDVFTQSYKTPALPVVTIPTTSGTGSEVTQYAILTDESAETKRGIAHQQIFPVYSFLDGKYMNSLPTEQTINTVIDAFSHAAEGYLAARSTPITDILALESIGIIGGLLNKLDKEKLIRKDRDSLLYASMLAGIVIAQTGTTICHAMGYSLTYFKKIDHGRANGLLFPAFLRHSMNAQDGKVTKLLEALGLHSIEEFEVTIEKLFEEKIILTKDELGLFSEKAFKTGNVENTIPKPTKKNIFKMFYDSF
ncbi:MAG: iron-containing alcohol dehydrogenase [Bacteriovoracaceae bacterium]|nr:iron-containing alcohol dehydrogenase [Bacteriovoracaceae bacterium]